MARGDSTENLLLSIETTANLAGVRAVKEGFNSIPPAIAGMSNASRAAFNAMDADAKKVAMSTLGISQAEQQAFLNLEKINTAVVDNTTKINVNIGAFAKRGEVIDRNSVKALAAYRAEGDALAVLLARMGASEQQLNRIGVAISKVEMASGGATAPDRFPMQNPRGDEQLKKVPGSARTAANALAMLSTAALTGSGSIQGMMVATGGLVTGLAALSNSARIAAAATGIGALVTVAAVVGMALYRMGDAAKASEADIKRLNNYSASTIDDYVGGLRKRNDELVAEAAKTASIWDRLFHIREKKPGEGMFAQIANDIRDSFGLSSPAMRALEKNQALTEEATRKLVELESKERDRLRTQQDAVREQIQANALRVHSMKNEVWTLDTYRQQNQEISLGHKLEEQRIRQQFFHRDEHGKIVALTAEQTKSMGILLEQNAEMTRIKREQAEIEKAMADSAYRRTARIADAASGLGGESSRASYEAKEAQIKAEGDLDILRGRDAVEVEKVTQAKIQALRKATVNAARDDAKTIVNVLLESGSRQIRAIGHAADTVRRIEIGAQAAKAGVESAIEFGRALGSAAAMDWRGAALHTASALSLAKAAMLGAKESLGGGGGGSAGGGSGGGGDPAGTFRPRSSTEGQGGFTLNLITTDPFGRNNIQRLMWEINRSEILNVPPIAVPPTTGVQRVA